MQFAKEDIERVEDRVYAAMETGNFDQARTLLDEYQAVNPSQAARLRADISADYGTAL